MNPVRRSLKDDTVDFLSLKVPHYTVFHQFHTANRSPTILYSIFIAPNPSLVLNFSCLKVALLSAAVSVPAALNANELRLLMPALPATRPSQREDAACTSGSMR